MKKTVYGIYGFIMAMAAALVMVAGCEGITDGGNPFAPVTYKAEKGTTPNGTVTVTPENAAAGANVNIIVEPDQGYRLKTGSLKVNGVAVTTGSGNQWTFVMPASNVTVTAEFEQVPDDEHRVSIGNFTGGSIAANPEYAAEGGTVTLTVTPVTGYKLKANSLKANDGAVTVGGAGNTYTFTMPDAAVTVTAEFELLSENEHSVTIDSSLAGGGIGTDKTNAEAGDTVTLTVTPDAGYEYTAESLTVTQTGGGTVPVTPSGNTYTFTMPADDVTVTAEFKLVTYGITITPPSNGTVTAKVNNEPATTATMGTSVTLTATAEDGYLLQSVTVTDGDGGTVKLDGTGNTRTFTMPASDVTVTAAFVDQDAPVYTVTIPASFEHGTVTAKANNTTVTDATEGTPITLTAVPDSGYQLASLTVTKAGGDTVPASGTGNTRTFAMPEANVTVAATFTPRIYNISITPPGNGNSITAKVNNTTVTTATVGTSVTLTVSAASGYQYTAGTLQVNSGAVTLSSSAPYTFTMPASSVTVTAAFEAVPLGNHTITVLDGITTDKPSAKAGDTVILTVDPVAGYLYTEGSLRVNGSAEGITPGGTANTYTFIMPDTAVTVTATFTAKPYNINITPPGNGNSITAKVNNTTAATATVGTVVTLTVNAAGGYEYTVGSLKVNDSTAGISSGGAANTYTFTMPANDVTVTAAFEASKTYTIAYPTLSHGNVTGVNSAAAGTKLIVLIAHPDAGYQYAANSITVTKEGGGTVPVAHFDTSGSFTMPADNVTVTAQFTAKSYSISITDPGNGNSIEAKVNGSAAETATVEDTVTIEASTAESYEFKSATVTKKGSGTVEVSGTGNTRTFAMPADDITVAAVFGPIGTYAISIPASFEHGSVTPSTTSAAAGTEITLTVQPTGGYRLKADTLIVMKEGGDTVDDIDGSGNTWKFIMPAEAVSVQAVFELNTYNITLDEGIINGTVTVNKTGQAGNNILLTPEPEFNYDYVEDSIAVTQTDDSKTPVEVKKTGGNLVFVMPASDVTVTAEFAEKAAVINAGLYVTGSYDTPVADISGRAESTMIAKALGWIKASGTTSNGKYTIVLDTSEEDASASGYIIGTYDQMMGSNSHTGNRANLTITLRGATGGITVGKMAAGPLFILDGQAALNDKPTLILENITLVGHADNTSPLVITGDNSNRKGGVLQMENGSAISGNTGGGVSILKNGTFNMNGGTIKGNSAVTGAAVLGVTGATFTKTGGTIYGSTGGDANTPEGGGHVIEIGTNWRDTEAGEDNNTADEGFWEN